MTIYDDQDGQLWNRPLKRVREIEAKGYQEIVATGESNAVDEMNEVVQQWTHTQLAGLLQSWMKMNSETKRRYMDTMETLGQQLKTETGLPPEQCGAKAIAQMVEVLGDMTPKHRDYAYGVGSRILGHEQVALFKTGP